jgi:hypothetical protein
VRTSRRRLALVGVSALAFSVIAAPGVAEAKKVSEKASGGAIPDAVLSGGVTTAGVLTQEIKFKGGKVKGKQVLDVDLILNSSDPDSAPPVPTIFAPKGENVATTIGYGGAVRNVVNLELSDQSRLTAFCNPLIVSRPNCNYLQSAGTVATGSFNQSLNPTFKGLNPKGTWTVVYQDITPGGALTTVGETTIEIKTGKKFAKES